MKRFTASAFPGLLAVVALVLVPLAGSGQTAKQKVLPLRVSSNKLGPEDLKALTDQVIGKLKKYPTLDVMAVPGQDPMDMMVDAGCADFDAACLAGIGASQGADRILYTEVSQNEGRFQVVVRMVDVKTRESKSPEGGVESREKLGEFVNSALERVLGPEPSPEPVLARVDISTSPAGAEVYMDKDFVGVTPVTLRLKAGSYTVRVSKVGFKEDLFPLVVDGDKPMSRAVTLAPIEVAKPIGPVPVKPREVESTPFYKTWWFWTACGAVVVAGGTTAFVLARKGGDTVTGGATFTVNSKFADKDVTLFPSR
jgi:hypothetical protein